MRRVRVPHLPVGGVLDAPTRHRLQHVLRLADGARVLAFDGTGHTQLAELRGESLIAAGPVEASLPPARFDLVVAVVKHNAMDLAIRMATEAGVHHIHPVITERTVALGDRIDRWQRIVTAAVTQCGRAQEPVVHPVRPLTEAVAACSGPLFFGRPGESAPDPTSSGTLIVGPEGGLSPREEAWLITQGAHPMGMGPHILRTETACAVGIATLLAFSPSGDP